MLVQIYRYSVFDADADIGKLQGHAFVQRGILVDTFHVGREIDNQSVKVFHVSAFAYDLQLYGTLGSCFTIFACQFQTRGNRVFDRINRYVGIYVAVPVYGLCIKLEVEWNTVQGIHFYDGFFDGDVFQVTAPIVNGIFINLLAELI